MSAASSDVILDWMMSLHPKSIDLTLDRMWRLLSAVGHPERELPPIIHIAGTNGKGSTQAMFRAGLEAAGQSVHAYTSPHLVRFHERIRVAGELISEEDLMAILQECWEVNDGEPITYFEITTVAALMAFARTKADWTLLEVGLGGRHDSTNVVDDPKLTVITPVDYDHQQYLGETLPEIAHVKAGIIKRGVPVVVGPQHDVAMEVIEREAARMGAPVLAHGQHWHVAQEHGRMVYQDERGLLDLPLPKLPGAHQIENAGIVITGLRALGFGEEACEAAVTNAYWPARFQRLRHGPLIDLAPSAELWLDGGHNASAGRALSAMLDTLPDRKTYLIAGILKTKDVSDFLSPLAQHAERLYAVDIPDVIATTPAAEIAEASDKLGLDAQVTENVAAAVSEIAQSDPAARILICGSLYLAGHVLAENG